MSTHTSPVDPDVTVVNATNAQLLDELRYRNIPAGERMARIPRAGFKPTEEEVRAYLPGNYRVLEDRTTAEAIYIAGHDNAGWTLDDYVIPRLGSGLIAAMEVDAL